jgi:hypothetical protein
MFLCANEQQSYSSLRSLPCLACLCCLAVCVQLWKVT